MGFKIGTYREFIILIKDNRGCIAAKAFKERITSRGGIELKVKGLIRGLTITNRGYNCRRVYEKYAT